MKSVSFLNKLTIGHRCENYYIINMPITHFVSGQTWMNAAKR